MVFVQDVDVCVGAQRWELEGRAGRAPCIGSRRATGKRDWELLSYSTVALDATNSEVHTRYTCDSFPRRLIWSAFAIHPLPRSLSRMRRTTTA